MWIHAVFGTLIVLLSLILGIIAITQYGVVLDYLHAICGIIYLALPLILAVYGYFVKYRLVKMKWTTRRTLQFKFVHQACGWIIMLFAHVIMYFGLELFNMVSA